MKTLLLFVLLATLISCSDPVTPQAPSQRDSFMPVAANDCELLLSIDGPVSLIYSEGQSETTSITPLGIVDFQSASVIKLEFDYISISKPGITGNNFTLFQNSNPVICSGTLPNSNYQYLHYEHTFDSFFFTPGVELFYRLTLQYSSVTVALKNVKLYKVQ